MAKKTAPTAKSKATTFNKLLPELLKLRLGATKVTFNKVCDVTLMPPQSRGFVEFTVRAKYQK
jgi:hypothetical protein